MLNCINPELNQKVHDLQKKSGLSDFPLRSQIRHYLTNHNGRLPELDELKGANSEPYLYKDLNLPKGGSADIKTLLEKTGAQTFSDAIISLNNTYRDLEIEGHELNNDTYYLKVRHRPTVDSSMLGVFDDAQVSPNVNVVDDHTLIVQTVNKLASLYGITIHRVKEDKLPQGSKKGTVRGYIQNGEVYIVEGNNGVDTKLHEMMHLILGSVKFQNPSLYYNLVAMAPQFSGFKEWARNYVSTYGKDTLNDLSEEFMVSKIANYLSGQSNDTQLASMINNNPEMWYQTMYHMNRLLDSVFMGGASVKAIPASNLYNYTFRQVANMVNSAVMQNKYYGSLDDAQTHRIEMNLKKHYMQNDRLLMKCE